MYLPSFFRSLRSVVTPRVLLAQTWADDQVLRGVARFARERGWLLDCSMRWTHGMPRREATPWDGAIADFAHGAATAEFAGLLQNLPVVKLHADESVAGPEVTIPPAEIARQAAQHFGERGFKNFAFVFSRDESNARVLARAFAEALPDAAKCHGVEAGALAKRIGELPKPLALLAANDLLAATVVRLCEATDLKVPEDVAVLGVGDDELLCTLGRVALSSIDCGREAQGYQAAALLARVMAGERVEGAVAVAPLRVTLRRSTDTFALPEPAAARVLRFLRDNYQRSIDGKAVERIAGREFRRVESVFRKHLGRTFRQELMRLRIEHAKRLLADDRLSFEMVAQRSGFSNRYHFDRMFCRLNGLTPRNYRQTLYDLPEGVSREASAPPFGEVRAHGRRRSSATHHN